MHFGIERRIIKLQKGDGQCDERTKAADRLGYARRTRFYGAMIDSEYLEKGKNYDEMPDVYLIYISETDLWKAGKTI